jgi:hypothetical protein
MYDEIMANNHRPNCLHLQLFTSFRPKSVPNSPSIPRAFTSLRQQLTTAWSSHSTKKKQQQQQQQRLTVEDKRKWPSAYDCSKY